MITRRRFCEEFAELAADAGITEVCSLDFPAYMAARHRRDPRAYAEDHELGEDDDVPF